LLIQSLQYQGIDLHLLATRSNVPRSFDDPLAPIVMLIQLFSEPFKHGDEWAYGLLGLPCVRHFVVSFALVLVHWLRRIADVGKTKVMTTGKRCMRDGTWELAKLGIGSFGCDY
jgi:hypothetical protein